MRNLKRLSDRRGKKKENEGFASREQPDAKMQTTGFKDFYELIQAVEKIKYAIIIRSAADHS